jgi:hypothetical protein
VVAKRNVANSSRRSMHASGHAIDIGDPRGPRRNTDQLLAIYRALLPFKSSGVLDELIYGGPGGGGWRSEGTRAAHEDHIHAGASERSMAKAGLVDVDTGSGTPSAAPASASRSAGSGGGFAGGGSRYGSYEEAATIAALLSGGAHYGAASGGKPSTGAGDSALAPVRGEGAELAARAAKAAGLASYEEWVRSVAIAGGESGWDPRAHNPNASTGDDSYGLWQINMIGRMGPERRKALGISDNQQLFDPTTNARGMMMVSGGGRSWSPWSVYRHGRHLEHVPAARAAVDAVRANPGGAGTDTVLKETDAEIGDVETSSTPSMGVFAVGGSAAPMIPMHAPAAASIGPLVSPGSRSGRAITLNIQVMRATEAETERLGRRIIRMIEDRDRWMEVAQH